MKRNRGILLYATSLVISCCFAVPVNAAGDVAVSTTAILPKEKLEWKNVHVNLAGIKGGAANMQLGALAVFKTLDTKEKVRWALDLIQDPANARDREVLYGYPLKDLDAVALSSLVSEYSRRGGGRVAIVGVQQDSADDFVGLGWPVKWDQGLVSTLHLSAKKTLKPAPYMGTREVFHALAVDSIATEDFIIQVNSDSKTRVLEARRVASHWLKPLEPQRVDYLLALDKRIDLPGGGKPIPLVTTSLAWPTQGDSAK